MDYEKLDENTKNMMYDEYLRTTYESPFQEEFRVLIGREFWLIHNPDKVEYYYNKLKMKMRKEKISKLNEKIIKR